MRRGSGLLCWTLVAVALALPLFALSGMVHRSLREARCLEVKSAAVARCLAAMEFGSQTGVETHRVTIPSGGRACVAECTEGGATVAVAAVQVDPATWVFDLDYAGVPGADVARRLDAGWLPSYMARRSRASWIQALQAALENPHLISREDRAKLEHWMAEDRAR
jgi:hypothetical protein